MNPGGTWDSIAYYNIACNNNYATTQFYGGGFSTSANWETCVGGTQDNGSFGIKNYNGTTNPIYGGDDGPDYISQQNSNLAYVTSWFGGTNIIGRTTSFMSSSPSFTFPTGQPGSYESFNLPPPYQINYADGNQLYFATHAGLWRTTDEGTDWTRLNQTGDDIAGIQHVGCTNATNPSVYFASYVSPNAHFYRITNAQTFTPGTPTDLSASIPLAVQGASFGEISQTPSGGISTTLFMCTTNYSSIPHIYKVTNANGNSPTWTDITGDIHTNYPKLAVNEVQADPLNSNNIFAATDYGLYYTTNGGTNWSKETRIPNTWITEMQLRASDRKLFLFTYGRGVWYCSLASIGGIVQQASVEPTPATPQLQFSLYPNPATQKLTVNPQQELSSSARIAIYSSDGRMISESAWNPTGGQGQEVNISSLPSGAYFLQITDGNLIAKNKFVKM